MSVKLDNILAIDTSSSQLMLALQYASDRRVKSSADVERSHGMTIMKKISDLMGSADLQPNKLDAIIVATGPGSFTGLRIGLAAGKGMAESLGIPIIGINMFQIANQKVIGYESPGRLLLPFKRDAVFVADAPAGRWQPEDARTVAVSELLSGNGDRPIFTIARDFLNQYQLLSGLDVRVVEYDAGDLLDIGYAVLTTGHRDDIAALEPLYLQKSQAEIAFDQRQQK